MSEEIGKAAASLGVGAAAVPGMQSAVQGAIQAEKDVIEVLVDNMSPVELLMAKRNLEEFFAQEDLRLQRMPKHKSNRRTFLILGKPKHYQEVDGELVMVDGPALWLSHLL